MPALLVKKGSALAVKKFFWFPPTPLFPPKKDKGKKSDFTFDFVCKTVWSPLLLTSIPSQFLSLSPMVF